MNGGKPEMRQRSMSFVPSFATARSTAASFGRLAIISSTFRRRTVRASTNASIAPSVAPTTTTIVPPTTPKIAPAPSVSSDAGTSAATQTAYMSA